MVVTKLSPRVWFDIERLFLFSITTFPCWIYRPGIGPWQRVRGQGLGGKARGVQGLTRGVALHHCTLLLLLQGLTRGVLCTLILILLLLLLLLLLSLQNQGGCFALQPPSVTSTPCNYTLRVSIPVSLSALGSKVSAYSSAFLSHSVLTWIYCKFTSKALSLESSRYMQKGSNLRPLFRSSFLFLRQYCRMLNMRGPQILLNGEGEEKKCHNAAQISNCAVRQWGRSSKRQMRDNGRHVTTRTKQCFHHNWTDAYSSFNSWPEIWYGTWSFIKNRVFGHCPNRDLTHSPF